MPGYKPQVKSTNGDMVDIPIAATYDENGNRLTEQYVSTIAQTFTDEEKAQARANIGAADASGGAKVYRHFISYALYSTSYSAVFSFEIFSTDADPYEGNWPETIRGKCFNANGYAMKGKASEYPNLTMDDAVRVIGVKIDTDPYYLHVYAPYVGDKGLTMLGGALVFMTGDRTFFTETVQEMP